MTGVLVKWGDLDTDTHTQGTPHEGRGWGSAFYKPRNAKQTG